MIQVSLLQIFAGWLLAVAFAILAFALGLIGRGDHEKAKRDGARAAEALQSFAFWASLPTADEGWQALADRMEREDAAIENVRRQRVDRVVGLQSRGVA